MPASPQRFSLLALALIAFLGLFSACDGDGAQPPATPPPPSLEIRFINVGQGDAILIRRDDTTALVDGGPRNAHIEDYLDDLRLDDIDVLVATHPHADHIGGLIEILDRYKVNEIWVNGADADTETYAGFAAALTTEVQEGAVNQIVNRGYSAQMDGLNLQVLNPTNALSGDANEDLLVLRLTCGSFEVLLMGDATSESERSMLADARLHLDADVLKVGHHGSRFSSSASFLNAVTPEVAVIMVGASNAYDHPHEEALDRLAAVGATIYRTDEEGTITITSDCNTYTVATGG